VLFSHWVHQTSGNINFCDGIDYDTTERELCYFSFANALYWENKSGKITTEQCNKLPAGQPDRDTCTALKARDPAICKNNKNCLTFFKQDLSFCDDNFKDKSECIRDRALSSKDIALCDKINGRDATPMWQ